MNSIQNCGIAYWNKLFIIQKVIKLAIKKKLYKIINRLLSASLGMRLKKKNFELMIAISDQKLILLNKGIFQSKIKLQTFRKKIKLNIMLIIINKLKKAIFLN